MSQISDPRDMKDEYDWDDAAFFNNTKPLKRAVKDARQLKSHTLNHDDVFWIFCNFMMTLLKFYDDVAQVIKYLLHSGYPLLNLFSNFIKKSLYTISVRHSIKCKLAKLWSYLPKKISIK